MKSPFLLALFLAALLALLGQSLAAGDQPPLLVADLSRGDPGQRLLAVSLQGIANRHPDGPRVFLLVNPRDREWLDYCLRLSPRETQNVTLVQLFEMLRSEVEGQILYDPGQPCTLDIATTAAGLQQAVISHMDLGLPTLLDLRGRWTSAAEAYRWALENLLPQCHRSRAALLPPDSFSLRDFAIQQRMFTFSPPAFADDPAFQDLLHHLPPGAALYGRVPPALRPSLSRASHFLVPAADAANLSFFSRLDPGTRFHQYTGYLEPTAPRYLALIFDCSDLDFLINQMPARWGGTGRGAIPLGWALPAVLAEAAPALLRPFYADSYRSGLDQFILGPSGAGEIDLSLATAPYTFFSATDRARAALDVGTSLYLAPPDPARLGPALALFAQHTHLSGAFVLGLPALPPLVYDGVPALGVAAVNTVEEAITYLNRIPLDRRFAALLLNSRTLTPADALHIARHVANRYVVVPPQEMIQLMRSLSPPPQPGPAAVAITSVDYPESTPPEEPLPIKAVVEGPSPPSSVSVVYRPVARPLSFVENMARTDDGYWAVLPPLRCGGDFTLRIRAADSAGRIAWSPSWTLSVPGPDPDQDGLTDAEESLLLTPPDRADADGDGLLDGSDPSPNYFDHVFISYLGPVHPPNDAPYLPDPGGSVAGAEGRLLQPGQSCLYWLPVGRFPAGAPVVIALDALGPAALAVGADPSSLAEESAGDLTRLWYSRPLSPTVYVGGAFLRITCPPDSAAPLTIRGLAVVSPPEAPSIADVILEPQHPGPEQPILLSALIFSPKQIAGADLTYRVNQQGAITIPMQSAEGGQRRQARIPALDNRDQLQWWITARDAEGGVAATAPAFLSIGSRAREIVSLSASRDFMGDWTPAPDWGGEARQAPTAGLRDFAPVNLTGGTYTVWALAGGRGQGIAVQVGDREVGTISPERPDGWQQVGRIRLDAARHQVHLTSQAVAEGPAGAAPRYAAVILSADPTFEPPPDQLLDIYNALSLLFPRAGDALTGRVELLATGAGNLTGAEFSLDGQLLRRVSGPPFRLSLATARIPNGPHTLRLEAVDRAGPTGLAVEIPVIVAN